MGLLDGKVVVITGAGYGIGRAYALELAEHGASVVVNDLGTSLSGDDTDPGPAERVVKLVRERGGQAVANFEDVADWDGARRMIEQAVDHFGHLEGLVTNAAVFRDNRIQDASEEDWDRVVRVHLKGTAAPVHHAVRYWLAEREAGRPRSASIVTTTSRGGLVPWRSQAVRPSYCAAKAGVASLTQVLAMDLYDSGIRVNSISPSAYTRAAAETFGRGEAIEPDAADQFDPFDARNNAPVVSYLLSDRAQHVTGQVFRVHLGSTVMQITGWQYGRSVTTEGRWDAANLANALDTSVYGSILESPPESEMVLREAPRSRSTTPCGDAASSAVGGGGVIGPDRSNVER